MERLIAGWAEDPWNILLELFCREGVAPFPVLCLLPHCMLHTDSHAADDTDCNRIAVFPLLGADITFHTRHHLILRSYTHNTGA